MSKTEQYVGALSLAGVMIFVFGLVIGLWHVERGPSGATGSAAAVASATARPTPTAPGERLPGGEVQLGATVLTPRSLELVDLYVETGIPAADADLIAAAVDADVLQVQRTYGRRFEARPQVYVFADRGSYSRGVEVMLDEQEPTLATTHAAGVALGRSGLVAVDWSAAGIEDPLTAYRHEFTHLMIGQIARPTADNPVPTWLNEGSALLEEFTLPGKEWDEIRLRTTAASMVAARNYFALGSLRGSDGWGGRIGSIAALAYYEAAAAVEILRRDIGVAGVIRVLELMGQGETFDDAFLEVAGIPAASFEDAAPARFSTLTERVPGIVARMDGDVLRIRAYGFLPRSEITFDALGRSTRVRNTDHKRVVVDESGIWETSLGAGWPADTYTLTVTGASSASAQPITVTANAARTVK